MLVPHIDNSIRTAAVIGAGSMGAGIAAHLANAGISVLLFDVPSPEPDRSARARAGIDTQVKRRGFMLPEFAERVTALNTEDDWDRLSEADWIVEAVFEDLFVKHDTYSRIAQHRRPDSIVSSNTSTIPLAELVAGMDQDLKEHFLITHFFNPPRVMRLVEVVSSSETRAEVTDRITEVLEKQLGKVALTCRDTPGFIANRIGAFWMESAACMAMDAGISFELADALFSKPFGIPRTGVFGLFDYIGLQLVPSVWGSLHQALGASDRFHAYDFINHPQVTGLIERGFTGRTGPSGFYRGRDEVIDSDFSYRSKQLPDDPALAHRTARDVMSTDSPGGHWARAAFLETLDYCCATAPEICDTVDAIDQAMELGYGWSKGPFALADDIGLDFLVDIHPTPPQLLLAARDAGGFYPSEVSVLDSTGVVVARPQRDGVVTVSGLSTDAEAYFRNDSATIHQLPDGIGLLELHTPLNSIDAGVLKALETAVSLKLPALVVATDNPKAFSAGADLGTLASLGETGDAERIRQFVRRGADAMQALRFAPFPVVAAVAGLAIGGGAELVLHSDAVVFGPDAALGLPERTVGIIPGWGGCTQLPRRIQESGDDHATHTAFRFIADATPTVGAFSLAKLGIVGEADRITLSADHVISCALRRARELMAGYQAPSPQLIALNSAPSWDNPDQTASDARILAEVAALYTGAGEISELDLSEQETTAAVTVFLHPDSVARAVAMHQTKKPLRN